MSTRVEAFFASCPRGLEKVLAAELAALSAQDIHAADGGVHFAGPLTSGYAVNLHSRVASRVLWRAHRSRYRTEHDIYEATRKCDWPRWFAVTRTLRVDVSAVKSPVKSLEFVTLRVKDAICDTFRVKSGERPSVDTRAPDVRVQAFLTASETTLYIDLSGEPLFKRGYRREAGAAPLRENLAAGMLGAQVFAPSAILPPGAARLLAARVRQVDAGKPVQLKLLLQLLMDPEGAPSTTTLLTRLAVTFLFASIVMDTGFTAPPASPLQELKA